MNFIKLIIFTHLIISCSLANAETTNTAMIWRGLIPPLIPNQLNNSADVLVDIENKAVNLNHYTVKTIHVNGVTVKVIARAM